MLSDFRVSVIIPTWNRRKSLLEAISSALQQSLPPTEILVCDDGSDDGSNAAVTALGDDRVRWLPGLRCGRPAGPRNRGISASRCEWIAFLDDDDVWLSDKLESQARCLATSGLRACSTNALRVGTGHSRQEALLQNLPVRLSFSDLLRENRIICSSVIARRTDLINAGGFPESEELAALEDYALWLRLASKGDWASLDIPLLKYRDEPSQSLRSNDVTVWEQRKRILSNLTEWNNAAGLLGLTRKQHWLVFREQFRLGFRWLVS